MKYLTDYKLVRGFDYYTSTTFEFVSESLGAQNTLLGGGRYDLLIEQLGGKPTPAIGFAAGIERLMIILENGKYIFPDEKKLKLFIVTMGDESRDLAIRLISRFRSENIRCDTDFLNRSVKSQMKEANRQNAEYVIVIGDEEMRSDSVKLKNMSDGSEAEVSDIRNISSKIFN